LLLFSVTVADITGRCTDEALADYRSADNWHLTIDRLLADYRLIQEVTKR